MAKDIESQTAPEAGGPAPDLRLLDRRAFVGFPPLTVAPGLVISDFALQIPDVTFPFNLAGGAMRYQRKTLLFGLLELSVDAEVITRRVAEVAGKLTEELDELKLHFRPGYLEGQARFRLAERTPITFKAAFDGDGERLAVYLYDVRLYGFAPTPAARVPVLLSRAVAELEDLLPDVELRGASGFTSRLLPQLCQLAAVSRGFKVPALDQARLSAAEVSPRGLRLRFSSGGLPPPTAFDEELLLTLEGARAFADAESLVARGRLAEAREAYLKLGDASEAHPFAAERLLSLLVADPQAHEMALDVAAALLKRREKSPAALWAEAVVRERRGEGARAAERFLALSALARKASEDTAAFFAAEAAARAARDKAPQMAVKALHELLGIKPDHLPSLKALARASDQAKDRAGAVRAWRRIAALARDPAEAAEAHVHMARLCAETEDDVAGARLHCEAALRLAPDHPDALLHLGELCHRAGEHLRGIRALDRLREVAMARHELPRVGQASLLAGRIWESGLNQPENALLRYREAASLLPTDPEPHHLAARVAEALGKLQEALSGYQQAVELAGPGPTREAARRAAHASLHALSRLHRVRLGDPAKAREYLEAALALDPRDGAALEELIPYFRAAGRAAELADACEKAAAVTEDTRRRAALWAEAGELFRGRLGNPERAERLLASALEADPRNKVALEGLLALAEGRRDGPQLCRCLKALAELSSEPAERVRLYRRLAVAARDLAFDLELAAQALQKVLELEPNDLAALGELCALHRRRPDMAGLAVALEQRARVAEAQGDRRLASAALRELAQVLELRLGRVGEALVALEKAARLSPDQLVLLELADLSLRCDRPQHARRALEDVLGQLTRGTAPERVADVRARLGRACELLGDVDAAVEHYAAAWPLRRLDDALAERLEALYQQAGRRQELGELWASRAQALAAAERRAQAAPLYFKSAEVLIERGEREAALARLDAALEADPDGPSAPQALEAMAGLELARGNRGEAARLWARRAGLLEDGREAARLLFKAAEALSGTPGELPLLDEAIGRDGAFAPVRIRRAERLLESEPARALEDLEAALAAPGADPDAPSAGERIDLSREAAAAANASNRLDAARRHLVLYVAERPGDLGAQRELAALHRRAGALDALCELLGELWPRLAGDEQLAALREYATLSLELRRDEASMAALRALLGRNPKDAWAARSLWTLLAATAVPGDEAERLGLLDVLIAQTRGDEAAEWYARRAELHRAAGRLAGARDDYAEAALLSLHPQDFLRKVAELAREAGDERGELAAWRAALSRAPRLSDAAAGRLLTLSRGRLSAHDFEAAREGFATCVALPLPAAERCEAWFGLAEAALALGDRAAAAAAWLEAASAGPSRRRLEALLRRAELLESGGDLAGAAGALERALQLSPRHPVATASLKRVLRALGDFGSLAEVLAAEAAQAPRAKAAPLFAELGYLYLDRLDQPGPAEAAFGRVAQLDKGHVEARRILAGLLFDRGEPAGAARSLEEAARLAPPERAAELLWEGAERAAEEGEPALALRLSRQALAYGPLEGGVSFELAEVLYLRGAVAEALPLARALAARLEFAEDPEHAEQAHLMLADLAAQAGDAALAERTLRELVAARPLSSIAAERLAALLEPSDPRGALEVLWRHAQRLSAPERAARRLRWLAQRVRQELSDVELASRMLNRAAELVADPLPIHRELASLYRQAGRTEELLGQLNLIARLCREAGEPTAAIDALEEASDLAEQSGRVDEALAALASARNLLEQAGDKALAARVERRRAELLRDARLDLTAAEQALEQSFNLSAELFTARLGAALARQRDDARAQVAWLTRAVPLSQGPRARAATLLELARLYDGPLASPADAERVVREAVRLDPALKEAGELLVALLERDGRLSDLAALREEAAQAEADPDRRVALLLEAASIYRDRAGRPEAAAAALLAARAARPDDLELTARVADLLHEAGRGVDASEFDALLLEADPFRARVFERHVRFLKEAGDPQALAHLMLRRAQRQNGAEAAESYLAAANAFRAAGALEQALLCEDQAFETAPDSEEAFGLLRARAEGDPRRLSELLAARARVLPPGEAVPLLRERAERLAAVGEALKAAAAYDDLLALAADDVPALSARAELAARDGGPVAAQPYDRRLLAAGGEALPLAVRVRTQLRLGHASVGTGAYRDAADAFEAVVGLDPEGERGREALSLLAEVHAKTRNVDGLYRTTLRLAKRAPPGEVEALLRRAADLFEDPRDAIEALLPLSQLRPGEARIVDRTAAGLRTLGRYGDLLELYERGAAAAGGPRAAELLLEASRIAEAELADPERAFQLKARAGEAAPDSPDVLRVLAAAQRQRGDGAGLEDTLGRLVKLLGDADEAAPLRLELARLSEKAGDAARARAELEAVVARGAGAPGYAQALEGLHALYVRAGDAAGEARALSLQAEVAEGPRRAALRLDAARAYRRAQDVEAAVKCAREALQLQPGPEAALLLAELYREREDLPRAAEALVRGAALSPAGARGPLLLEAAHLREASGGQGDAASLFERVARDHPELLSRPALADHLLRLGRPERAAEVGFGPALEAGELDRALVLADWAKDAGRARQALWALVERGGEGAGGHADRLAGMLREGADAEELLRLAALCEAASPERALALAGDVAAGPYPEKARRAALERLEKAGRVEQGLERVLPTLGEGVGPELVEWCLARVRGLVGEARAKAVEQAARALPGRAKGLWREQVEHERAAGRGQEAAAALARLIELEPERQARAALYVELGEVSLRLLREPAKARGAFEKALVEDGDSVPATRYLAELYKGEEPPDRFLAMAERLIYFAGESALSPKLTERLVQVYERKGRLRDAYVALARLEETPARMEKRSGLALELGLVGEALRLRERLAKDDTAELESILFAYLVADLVPFAARLCEKLMRMGHPLDELARRMMAEKGASVAEAAPMATRLWPDLLRQTVMDADGWTVYAEALRMVNRPVDAERMDGFGAALTGTDTSAPAATMRPLARARYEFSVPRPEPLVPVTSKTMPRLFATVNQMLTALGAPDLTLWLHVEGGAEAYLLSSTELCLGAGALACFSVAELGYLCALALALGENGHKLTQAGPVEGLEAAAATAFAAVPASLAACRVLAQLHDDIRGGDPSAVDVSQVIRKSSAFRAIALQALLLV